ncbi:DUF4230 domain-containing protein [Modestobacter muralis]|uniref:DUF4230 domain-containing protein n=1 Tax=Modestobacter muralis TaxID=1608614 RepID=A0A6P0HAM9_9ACTN|nr:DUF4230 domain-containing protein [Modestobacter muralis]NEN51064.1 DUF4230 domain-containing protein [Modestobacter muralis]
MPTLLQHPDTSAATVVTRRPRRLRRRLVAAGIGAAVAVPLVGVAWDRVTGWSPLEQEVVDRSTPPLLLALDDLAEYHAATGTFQVVIDQERDTPYVPSVISGERTSLLATGSVDAYVDLTDLGPERVQLSADGTSATISLPAPRLDEPTVDPAQSRVLDRDRGLLDRVGDAVVDEPVDDTALYAAAGERLAAAAAASDLRARAEENTRELLTGLGSSFGVPDVTVTFAPTADAQG